MSLTVRGSTALVTGASGGIGAAIARALHRAGARVVLTARREDVLADLAAELGDRVDVLAADLTTAKGLAAIAARARSGDILVSNAGLPASGRLEEFTVKQVDRAIDVNLRAPIRLAREVAQAMAERRRGHLVFVGSLAGKAASPRASLYNATKFGLRGFALALREDLRDAGVGVTAVYPGFIREAGMFAQANISLPAGVGTRTPEDVGAAVLRGIERNKAEIDVAPFAVRVGSLVASVAPGVAAAVQRRTGGVEIAERLAAGQAHLR